MNILVFVNFDMNTNNTSFTATLYANEKNNNNDNKKI